MAENQTIDYSCSSIPESKSGHSFDSFNATEKFATYRLKIESLDADYKQAKDVVLCLREEINAFRETEKSYQFQVSSLQGRIQILEDKRKDLLLLQGTIRDNGKAIESQMDRITSISNVIQELDKKCKNLINSINNEKELLKRISDLELLLRKKDNEMSNFKNEIKSVLKDKEEMIQKCMLENENLKEELISLKMDEEENCNKVCNVYKKKLAEYERIIKHMEEEKRSILGDYEVDTPPKEINNSGDIAQGERRTYPDSTVGSLSEERENNMIFTRTKTMSAMPNNIIHSQSNLSVTDSRPKKFGRQKVKLDITEPTSESSQPDTKRRLYSQNSNYLF